MVIIQPYTCHMKLSSAQPLTQNDRFRIRENLDPDIMARFSPLTLAHEPDGGTTQIGPVRNLAELRRVLLKIRDLKLTLLSVINQ